MPPKFRFFKKIQNFPNNLVKTAYFFNKILGIYVEMRAKFNQIISFSLKYAEMARIQDGGHFCT